ncbi:ATP-dependent DNA helicase PIF1 [Trichonephila clavipes]|nr:ATP-dependent DNA helicase PIF1 [Trichonephila clavipes]
MMQERISESAKDHEERLECQRNVTHPSKMAIWNDKENAAYSYNPSIDYKSDASCFLGPMSITCQFCSAMKFKGETPGLCCSGGKVEDGYHFQLRQRNPSIGAFTERKVTAIDFYAYRIMHRASSFNIIFRSNDLFQHYLVDMFAKIDEGNVCDVGQLIILPSSFTGSPRYMHERTQGAMNNVRNYGDPDLFITFTCNPA